MFWNIALALLIAAATGIIAALGGHLASTKTWHRWMFWGGGLVIWVLIALQTYRTELAQGELQTQLNKIQKNTETPPTVTVNPPVVNLPNPPQHTHVQFAPANSPPNNPLIPYHEGQDLQTNVGFLNAGEFSVKGGILTALVQVVPTKEPDTLTWKRLYRHIPKGTPNSSAGTLLTGRNSGAIAIEYHSFYPANRLNKDDFEGLTANPPTKMLCELAKVIWHDDTGAYETHSMQCLANEGDGVFNWHYGSHENEELTIKH